MTLLTVTIPVYNAMPYLKEAVESILNQSVTDFELIIIDDGSTDNSYEYLNSIDDNRLKLIRQSNQGLGNTLNRLFDLATGKYVIRFDADDVCLKHRLHYQLKFMEENPEVVLSGTGINFLCDNLVVRSNNLVLTHNEILEKLLIKRFSLCHPSIIVRRDAFMKVGGYKIKGAGEDLDFFLRMSQVGKLANLDKVLLNYRLTFNSLSMKNREELYLGYDYAISCYLQRKTGKKELSFNDFTKLKVGFIYNTINSVEGLSENLYRKSVFFNASGQLFLRFLFLFLASLLRPKTSIYHIKRKMMSFFG